jgi:hypothetical protein
MMKKRVPWRLWDYGIEWVCEVMSLTANSNFVLTGETPNISEYLDFGYYNSVWNRDNAGVGNKSSASGLAYHSILGASYRSGF